MTVLVPDVWMPLRAAHIARAEQWTRPHLHRRMARTAHPVMDFLFEYYPYSPARLATWHPGAGVALAGDLPPEYRRPPYVPTSNSGEAPTTWTVDVDRVDTGRRDLVLRILTQTATREPQMNCFGLHEWAMVYRSSKTRHPIPLRMSTAVLEDTIEEVGLRCTHIDAYRFFTPDAAPLNAHIPTRANQPDMEQPGCLHATMDLYKYAMWFQPYLPGDLVLDCFALAVDTRILDMQASPYDLSDHGYAPVRVESHAGRREYVDRQRDLTQRGAVLRARLADCVGAIRPTVGV